MIASVKMIVRGSCEKVIINVLFQDLDGSLYGDVIRCSPALPHMKGDHLSAVMGQLIDEGDGLDWCYSNPAHRCSCSGLCRNKM